ncbi:pyridoxamine 5'-phosphate oxidase family protein [SAR86 cluster bacterium]|nr:pyridoxamine 5'-phosphate oxidase family protein [SAR86 cluster bacterium]
MIKFKKIDKSKPYSIFKNFYVSAIKHKQPAIEAVAISSFCSKTKEVDSRFVNLKYIEGSEWIFFSNYSSPKAIQFSDNKKISALFYWEKIDVQIRIKAKIKKTRSSFSDNHFKLRNSEKNILAITSEQSKEVDSYNNFLEKMKKNSQNISYPLTRPKYWGGFSFEPYCFEFWEGHQTRINKRRLYKKAGSQWNLSFLQP